MTPEAQLEATERALAAFALCETPDHVVGVLQSAGVRGFREDPACCPVARFLAARGVEDPEVFPADDDNDEPGFVQIDRRVKVELPRPVDAFVQLFDRGSYSELLDTWPGEVA